jgi:phosphatidylglycerophosphate synthase
VTDVTDVPDLSDPTVDGQRLAAAVKTDDGFFATYFVSSYSPYLVRAAARLGIAPDQVTLAALVVGLGAAAAFGLGNRAGLISGAVLLQVSFQLDVVDGQLARYTRRMSAFGGWFDTMADRTKEYAAYIGLAVGSVRGFDQDVWALAGAALAIQLWRHMLDLTTVSDRDQIIGEDAASRLARMGHAAVGISRTTNQRGWLRWAKRILGLPIGERLFLISVTAAVFRPKVTFITLLAWGAFALVYGGLGRVLRSFAGRATSARVAAVRRLRDDGPLAAALPSVVLALPGSALAALAVMPWGVALGLTGPGDSMVPLGLTLGWLVVLGLLSRIARPKDRLAWAVAPLLRSAEVVGVLRLASISSDRDLAAGYVLAAVVACGCYDQLSSRLDRVDVDPEVDDEWRLAALLTGGWPLRLVVAFALAAGGFVDPGFYIVAGALAAVYVSDATVTWKDAGRRRHHQLEETAAG